MQKDKKIILIFTIVLLLIVGASYFLFASGTTNKIKGSINGLTSSVIDGEASDLPIINYVVNSSGEKLVNTDIAVTINASSKYNIKKIEYSYDLKNWKKMDEEFNSKEVSAKLVFTKTINKKLYIRVINEKNYSSYAYETVVKIDKEKPSVSLENKETGVVVKASDNNDLSAIQYSNDNVNWEEEAVSGKTVTSDKELESNTYVRVVDVVGNISDVKKVK